MTILEEIRNLTSTFDQDDGNTENLSFALINYLIVRLKEFTDEQSGYFRHLCKLETTLPYKAPELKRTEWTRVALVDVTSEKYQHQIDILFSTCYDYAFN